MTDDDRPALTSKCAIEGPSDASMHVEVYRFDVGDCPAAHVRFFMDGGLFAANADGRLPHKYAIGDADSAVAVISMRDRGSAEISMLSKALRWAADQLERDDVVVLREIVRRD